MLQEFTEAPNVIRDLCFHCWRYPQCAMNPTEVIIGEMERAGSLQILPLLHRHAMTPLPVWRLYGYGES